MEDSRKNEGLKALGKQTDYRKEYAPDRGKQTDIHD